MESTQLWDWIRKRTGKVVLVLCVNASQHYGLPKSLPEPGRITGIYTSAEDSQVEHETTLWASLPPLPQDDFASCISGHRKQQPLTGWLRLGCLSGFKGLPLRVNSKVELFIHIGMRLLLTLCAGACLC